MTGGKPCAGRAHAALCLAAAAASLVLWACPDDEGPGEDGVTWHQDVAPIVREHCQTCHRPGNIAPFSLMTYEDASPIAGWLANVTESRQMPPFDADTTDECSPALPYRDDPSLTDAEIAMLRAWADGNAPEGDASDPTPLAPIPGVNLDRVDKTLTMPGSLSVEGDQDDFRCVVFELGTSGTRWIEGVEVRASTQRATWTDEERESTPAVLHHIVLFSDPTGQALTRGDLDAANSYPCFGGPAVPAFSVLGTWVPGSVPVTFPEGSGLQVEPGTVVIAQAHLHPDPGRSIDEQFEIDIQWTDSRPDSLAFWEIYGAFDEASGNSSALQPGPGDGEDAEFLIPAGAEGHTETFRYSVDVDQAIPVFGLLPHMHLAGVDIKTTILRGSGPDDACLAHVPRYDFNWQRAYLFDGAVDELPAFGPGDSLEIRCTYDNSLGNDNVADALDEQGLDSPVDIRAGDNTLDEMCVAIVGYILD